MNTGRRYYFLTIAEKLNITRAAEDLMVSQPSLTQYLNNLEKELDIKLIDRNFTPLRLTTAGRIYYNYLKDCKLKDEILENDLNELRTNEDTSLRIGIPLQKSYDITANIFPIVTEKISKYPYKCMGRNYKYCKRRTS
ncbi:transcription regulator [Lachnospiraceae bacterium TWA4]|nr:transcription regulator [Lachnospiraceae bacterium TWA4]